MRFVSLIISTISTIGLVYILNKPLSLSGKKLPRLGLFLSPQKGFWQNAEASNASFDGEERMDNIKANADVYFDDRLVPHIYAETNNDAYFVQGYLHAKFRLWQMEFQTHIAAGRLSEIRGKDSMALATDKFFRRLGMVYAAENCLKFMEQDAVMKQTLDAYTAGVNCYIKNIKQKDIPFEYKLMDYKPELWTNLKTALFLKLMSFDLTGQDDDIKFTNGKSFFGYDEFMKLFPNSQDSLSPIVSRGTAFQKPSITVTTPANLDSVYFHNTKPLNVSSVLSPDAANGSNNWAVDSSKTKSKRPILCNDPHLGLNLPSLWYEMQITTPKYSAYGASFPGSPAIIIGFNNNIAWGVTNAGRDVKDYYELQFKDASMKEYWFNGQWRKATLRNEVIKVKGEKDSVVEKIAVTDFGVVMYDKTYLDRNKDGKYIAVRWTAHDPSNELQTFMKLNSAKDYADYRNAISTYQCPGQNFVFAAKTGDVALTQQGKFVAKWQQQGDFLMKGDDSTFMWQGFIPVDENPYEHSPMRGYVSSANQKATDETYPYYLGRAGNFPPYRGYLINRKLDAMNNITVDDMKQLQTDNYNLFAETALPFLLKNIDESLLDKEGKKYIELLKDWNLNNAFDEKAATVFDVWWSNFDKEVFDDEFSQSKIDLPNRLLSSTIELMLHDSLTHFADNIKTKPIETISTCVNSAFDKTKKQLIELEKTDKLTWGKYQDTYVRHFTNLPSLSRLHLNSSGAGVCINAVKANHGPSWRMIVHLTDEIEAYSVYPGGQSGNPGSKFYDDYVTTWALGKYNNILFIDKANAATNKKVKWHLKFEKKA